MYIAVLLFFWIIWGSDKSSNPYFISCTRSLGIGVRIQHFLYISWAVLWIFIFLQDNCTDQLKICIKNIKSRLLYDPVQKMKHGK